MFHMSNSQAQFDFLKEYERDFCLTSLSILQLCRENSPYAYPLSTLTHQALMLSNGN